MILSIDGAPVNEESVVSALSGPNGTFAHVVLNSKTRGRPYKVALERKILNFQYPALQLQQPPVQPPMNYLPPRPASPPRILPQQIADPNVRKVDDILRENSELRSHVWSLEDMMKRRDGDAVLDNQNLRGQLEELKQRHEALLRDHEQIRNRAISGDESKAPLLAEIGQLRAAHARVVDDARRFQFEMESARQQLDRQGDIMAHAETMRKVFLFCIFELLRKKNNCHLASPFFCERDLMNRRTICCGLGLWLRTTPNTPWPTKSSPSATRSHPNIFFGPRTSPKLNFYSPINSFCPHLD